MKINNIDWQQRIKDCNPLTQGEIDALKLGLRRKAEIFSAAAIFVYFAITITAFIILVAAAATGAAFIVAKNKTFLGTPSVRVVGTFSKKVSSLKVGHS